MATILDGHTLSEKIKNGVMDEVERLRSSGTDVGLGLLKVGEDPSSLSYFQATLSACGRLGVTAHKFMLPATASVNEILNVVHAANLDERINGLLVLFPLPPRINPRRVVNEIVPEKDVDGLGYLSIGRLAAEESVFQLFNGSGRGNLFDFRYMPRVSGFLPCTPFGVIRLMEHYGIPMKGRHAVVLGKSLAVGKPLSMMLLAKGATVTVCHKETRDLPSLTRQADILCSAAGVKGLIRSDMVKEGAAVVDVGINVLEDGRIAGDVEFDEVREKASFITPVPGGVGPVTIAMLLENTVRSAHMTELRKNPPVAG